MTIMGYRDAGFLKECMTLQECKDFSGADPVLSRFGCVIQEKKNYVTGEIKVKRRIIYAFWLVH